MRRRGRIFLHKARNGGIWRCIKFDVLPMLLNGQPFTISGDWWDARVPLWAKAVN